MIKVGRITAALLLVAVGVLLLLDQFLKANTITLLLTWWPLLLVGWGVEAVIYGWINKTRKWKFDIIGMFTAVGIAAAVFTVAQPQLFRDFIRSVQFDFSMMKQMVSLDGVNFEQPIQKERISVDTESLQVEQQIGDVYIQSGTGDEIIVESLITVYGLNKEEARAVADPIQVQLEHNQQERSWTIRTIGADQIYRLGHKARIDLKISIPSSIRMRSYVRVESGDVYMRGTSGDAIITSHNGDILVMDIAGKVQTESYSGDVEVKNIRGNVQLHNETGDIIANRMEHDALIVASGGDVSIHDVKGNVSVSCLNGKVEVDTEQIGGDWDIKGLASDVTLQLPAHADMTITAESLYGSIQSDYLFSIHNRRMTGVVGNGQYQVQVKTNGSIQVGH
ncbi:DUF4097 family beta strand repeat-containing protein [Paenibacillus taiwanensis]|uniref:DUF4097 family beta strand repeat-containing protein n=1 Tax=Paenibacillus taiwanensis TaxID=401638 RepID=UPI000402D4A7|nr:DUF4097 family beta strand repeat-containing protein [Paenibacillus taiwanensis]